MNKEGNVNISRDIKVLQTRAATKPSVSVSYMDIKNINNPYDEKSVKSWERFRQVPYMMQKKEKNDIS